MILPTDLVIQSGPGLDIQWSITDDECIVLRVTRPQGSPCGIQRLTASKDSSWSCSESCGDTFNKIVFSSRPDISKSTSSASEDLLPVIQRKIARKWDKARFEIHDRPWAKDAATFFGTSQYESTEQLSYLSLEDVRTKAYRQRIPFHKVHLSRTFECRLKEGRLHIPTFRDEDCRKRLVAEYHPGYHSLDVQERNTICKRFRGYLVEGKAYDLICKGNEGILFSIDRICSADDLKTITEQVKKGSPLAELIGKDITAYSKRHEEEAKVLLNYLQRGKKRSCDGDRPLAKRQQPVQHGGVYGHEPANSAAALLDNAPNYLGCPSEIDTTIPSNVLCDLDADLDTWATLIDMDPLLNSWRPDGEAHAVTNESRLLSGTEYGMM